MKRILLLLTFTIMAHYLPAQDWVVPQEYSLRLSPFEFTEESAEAGRTIYTVSCLSCHGNPGRNNFLRSLSPQPGDPASEKYQLNSDGDIFYKVSEGRGQMPGFKNVLTQTDIWNVVSYIRTFNTDYVQVVAPPRRSDAPDYSYTALTLEKSDRDGAVLVKVTGFIEGAAVIVPDATVQLSAERYFGRQLLGDNINTNSDGIASFTIPEGIKGDREGNVTLRARLTEEDLYGIASTDTVLMIGEPVIPVSLTEKRAMWNTVRKAPVWLIITFTLAVFSVWGMIFYVLLAVRDMWVLGGLDDQNNSPSET
ncbi:MAG: cytochrome c [Bacteroidales bacterium]|nr:cytochrome c [Bacteroidales bacterium]